MSTRALLIVTAVLEVGIGIALLGVPSLIAEVLLGEGLSSPAALVVARVAGAALMSLGVACWLGRNGERSAQSWLIGGMLIYNSAVPILLIHAWIASGLNGIGLWPANAVHAALAVWCAIQLCRSR